MIDRLYCVNLYTSKIEEMKHFYCEILNIPVMFKGFNGNLDGIKIGFEENALQIALWDTKYWEKGFGGPVEIAIRGDLDKIYQSLVEKKYPVESIQDLGFGRILYIYDPDGNRLAAMQGE